MTMWKKQKVSCLHLSPTIIFTHLSLEFIIFYNGYNNKDTTQQNLKISLVLVYTNPLNSLSILQFVQISPLHHSMNLLNSMMWEYKNFNIILPVYSFSCVHSCRIHCFFCLKYIKIWQYFIDAVLDLKLNGIFEWTILYSKFKETSFL